MPDGPADSARLTRSAVLVAALALVDAEGLELLTMRRLAGSLHVDPMMLYRHARDKEDLLDGLTSLIYESLQIDPAASDWREEVHRFAGDWRRTLLDHPRVVPLLAVRPLVVPLAQRPRAALDLTEDVLVLLAGAGLSQEQAIECYRAIVSWLIGALLTEIRVVEATPTEPDSAIRLGFQHLPPGQYPHVRTAADALAHDHGERRFHTGLDALLDSFAPGTSLEGGQGARRDP